LKAALPGKEPGDLRPLVENLDQTLQRAGHLIYKDESNRGPTRYDPDAKTSPFDGINP